MVVVVAVAYLWVGGWVGGWMGRWDKRVDERMDGRVVIIMISSYHPSVVLIRESKQIHTMIGYLIDPLHSHDFTNFFREGFRHLIRSTLIMIRGDHGVYERMCYGVYERMCYRVHERMCYGVYERMCYRVYDGYI